MVNAVRGVVLFALFQAAWWACAVSAGRGMHGLAALAPMAFFAVDLALARHRRAKVAIAAIGAAVGVAVHAVLVAAGVVRFAGGGVPAFIATLSAAFAVALPLPRRAGRGVLGAVLGAFGGVASTVGAANVSALAYDREGDVLVACLWALTLPTLDAVAAALDNDDGDRRAVTVPRTFALFALLVVLSPVWVVAGAVVDVVRGARPFVAGGRPFITLRLGAFGLVYLGVSCAGLVRMIVTGLFVDGDRLREATYRHQEQFTAGLFFGVCRCFGLRFVVEGADCLAAPGPLVILVRHASIIDTLVPSMFCARQGDNGQTRRLRFVLKHELLVDPCLDIAGHRIPNHFVRRRGEDTDGARAGIAALGVSLGDDGILLYPEGTRFSSTKRAQAQAAVPAALADLASVLTHTLPPKPTGVDAALDAAPGADVVVVAHVGLDGFSHVKDIWSGALFGRTVQVRVWRVPRAAVPDDKAARARWLYREWQNVDALVRAGSTDG
jgi:1-acyl-sn-glycerol-3-phosphate acyltransferase